MSGANQRTTVRNERTELVDRAIAYLRELYPTKTAEHVAGDLGICPSAVEKWLSRHSAPSLPTFGLLGLVYGPEFVSRVFPGWEWLSDAAFKAKTEKLKAHIEAAQRELENLKRQ